jgi:hypothetical protein
MYEKLNKFFMANRLKPIDQTGCYDHKPMTLFIERFESKHFDNLTVITYLYVINCIKRSCKVCRAATDPVNGTVPGRCGPQVKTSSQYLTVYLQAR